MHCWRDDEAAEELIESRRLSMRSNSVVTYGNRWFLPRIAATVSERTPLPKAETAVDGVAGLACRCAESVER